MRFDIWRRARAVLLLLGVLLSGACTDRGEPARNNEGERASMAPAPGRAGSTFVYECGDGLRFTARIEGETAWLFLPSGTISLPHVEAASGAKYSDGSVTFWSKGESAMLEGGNQPRTECSNNRAEAIWEDAKLRGADFRATGNEPGWYLEISREYGILLVTAYGTERYEFAPTEPSSDSALRKTTYKAAQAGHELTVTLEGRDCADSMSGAKFETTVTVMIDGNKLTGCGRPLH
ncbi:MAG: hypothetical protein AMJ66_08690 [Betaproteobacteria bacterium SG8_40]|nr:MAG: hypothetical protein AMJ66_08690 [Betaproteobacteria bacterium SG8_40]